MTLAQLLIGKTPQQRIHICYRVLEKMRLRHNAMGDAFRNGVINESEWRAFLSVWEQRHRRVQNTLNTIKENQNLFLVSNEATARTLKEEGKVLTTYDADIDIDNLE